MNTQISPYNRTDTRSLKSPSTDSNAALRGATLAFAKPPIKPKPSTYVGKGGALAAATKADHNAHSALRGPASNQTEINGSNASLMPQHSGSSIASRSIGPSREVSPSRWRTSRAVRAGATGSLKLPYTASERAISPSHIAASLAASRSAQVASNESLKGPTSSPAMHGAVNNSGQPSLRSVNRSRGVPEDALDTTPIPPTTSLIGLFEQSRGTTALITIPKPATVPKKPSQDLEVKSPVPVRAKPAAIRAIATRSPKSSSPMPRSSDGERIFGTPPTTPVRFRRVIEKGDVSSDDSFASSKDYRPRSTLAPISRPMSVSAESRRIDAMADAIVASSLASSRAASPSKPSLNVVPPPPTPRRTSTTFFHHNKPLNSRTPSPAKGLRQTMRKPPKDDDDEDLSTLRKGRKNIMKKHPNKHHEGDRKRWRDRITERERKRYEAVWASNKGLHVSTDGPSLLSPASLSPPPITTSNQKIADSVSNIIVKDIWSRSRLSADILSEVWDLVDRTGTGMLSREEFVVGLWLIDQRLKGRKLPIRVGDSVWSSIAFLGGLKIKGNGGRNR